MTTEWQLQRAGLRGRLSRSGNPGGDRLRPEQAHRDLGRGLGGRDRAALGERWFVLAAPADSESFADFMADLPRIPMGGTGIGMGVAAAIRKLDRNGLDAPRQVVDVSGDGRETPPRENVVLIPMANALARARGVTVNGLAIVNEDDLSLATWYRDNVIAGPGSFVITAADYADFAEAIRKKLLREIKHQERLTLEVRRTSAQPSPPCGERAGSRSVERRALVDPWAETPSA